MTLPLKDMTTAPRDGSEVWLMLKNQNRMELRSWDEDRKQWRNYDLEYSDCYFSGWLDLKALVRDSERLKEEAQSHRSAIRHALQFLRDPSGRGDGHKDECIAACEKCLLTDRAAIDKEIGRG